MYKSFASTPRIRDIIKKYNPNILRLQLSLKHHREHLVFSQAELDRFCSIDEAIESAPWGNAIVKNLILRQN